MSSTGHPWILRATAFVVAAMFCAFSHAQTGDLVLTPDATVANLVTADAPASVAYDSAGNLYIADRRANVIRKVTSTGAITTIAGNGEQGFSGDGSAATAAELNLPSGVAVAATGEIYIADTGNCRVRVVQADGTIQTAAGRSVCGSSGDGGRASDATLRKPVALVFSMQGELLIVDAADHRIRKVAADKTISTFAGTGRQGFAGDGGPAIVAELDSPAGIAIDTAGNTYIADRMNQRIRVVDSTGTIHTIAGDGVARFRDGGLGSFVKPRSMMVDKSGALYVADSGNHRVRIVTPEGTATVAGTGEQGSRAPTGDARMVTMDRPAALASFAGEVAFADQSGRQVRQLYPSSISFPATTAGQQSSIQNVVLSNRGQGAFTVKTVDLPAGFLINGGTCGSLPFQINAGSSCTVGFIFTPISVTSYSGNVRFAGDNFVARSLLVKGVATGSGPGLITTNTVLNAGGTVAYTNSPLTLSAQISAANHGVLSGTVQFLQDGTLLGTTAVAQNTASWIIASPAAGQHRFTATYSGDSSFAASTSQPIIVTVSATPDFTLGTSGTTSQIVLAGGTALIPFAVQPLNGNFAQTVTFTATGLPVGATASFDPPTLVPGASVQTVLLSVKVPAAASRSVLAVIPFALLLCCMQRRRRVSALVFGVLTLAGCGGGFRGVSNNPGDPPTTHTYPITITATATANGVNITHSMVVNLVVQSK